jgi:SPP1 family predicted phage head-tail adaptor
MLFRDTVTLVTVTSTENGMGDPVKSSTSRIVFANEKSIRQTEFYQAQATGLRPELMFEIKTIEYQGEITLVHNGKSYSIIRTYSKNGEITELICSGLAKG